MGIACLLSLIDFIFLFRSDVEGSSTIEGFKEKKGKFEGVGEELNL